MVRANGIDIMTEAFGDPASPPLLLIQGANTSMIGYPDALCEQLADAGFYVVRYDNRDTGQSTAFTPGAPGYNVVDLSKDAIGVLDAYGIERSHIAGFSTGGMIVQHIAFLNGDRVLTATIGGSSPEPVGSDPAGVPESERLPFPLPKVAEMAAFEAGLDWTDKEAAIAGWVREFQTLQGSGDIFDADAVREFALREIARARSVPSERLNHPIAVATTPRWRHHLKEIAVPTLVIHGSDDPLLPIAHGEAMAAEIAGAKFVRVEGMGHILAPGSHYWSEIGEVLVASMN
jgi:pimeloyl-ACP methyl ester carboxylesterase